MIYGGGAKTHKTFALMDMALSVASGSAWCDNQTVAGKEAMDRVSGSGVFSHSPDALVTITRHEQRDIYVVEMPLRHLRSPDPFCVQWEYPMMVRAVDLDPTKLKRGGVAQ